MQRASKNMMTTTILAGIVTGMRSLTPLALLALSANRGTFAADASAPLSYFRSRGVLVAASLAAVGEMFIDKHPSTPSRLKPPTLAERLAIGGLVGAAIFRDAGLDGRSGVALGVGGALAGSLTGYYSRTVLGKVTNIPDVVWGTVEDIAAISIGLTAIKGYLQD